MAQALELRVAALAIIARKFLKTPDNRTLKKIKKKKIKESFFFKKCKMLLNAAHRVTRLRSSRTPVPARAHTSRTSIQRARIRTARALLFTPNRARARHIRTSNRIFPQCA
jgi:hypothetical protein